MFTVGIDVEKVGATGKVFHQLPQGSRRDGPVVFGLVFVGLCVDRNGSLKGNLVRGVEAYIVNNAQKEPRQNIPLRKRNLAIK